MASQRTFFVYANACFVCVTHRFNMYPLQQTLLLARKGWQQLWHGANRWPMDCASTGMKNQIGVMPPYPSSRITTTSTPTTTALRSMSTGEWIGFRLVASQRTFFVYANACFVCVTHRFNMYPLQQTLLLARKGWQQLWHGANRWPIYICIHIYVEHDGYTSIGHQPHPIR